MNIESGMFARTNDGLIVKVELVCYQAGALYYLCTGLHQETIPAQSIIKASYDLADLVEDGDYVNGERIYLVKSRLNDEILFAKNFKYTMLAPLALLYNDDIVFVDDDSIIKREDVRSILTKQEYEKYSMKSN